MILTDDIKKIIIDHARESDPFECVGIVFKNNNDIQVKKLKNLSKDAKTHIIIEQETMLQAAEGGEILAVYHSHINSDEFSLEDKSMSEKLNLKIIMCNLEKRSFRIYEPNGFVASYTARPWRWGLFTCVDLIKDFYKKELNISINNFENKDILIADADSEDSQNLYLNFFSKNNFKEVKNFKKHDLTLSNYHWGDPVKILTCCSVYLGNENFLQQNHFEESRIKKLTNKEKLLLTRILRHESLL